MKFVPRACLIALGFVDSATFATAHPGHEGHDLTWDLDHLAAHPFATAWCACVVAAGAYAAYRIARWGSRPTSARR